MIHHGIPWLGKKSVEIGRYYGSEALRNPKIQKKAIDYALDKLNPIIQNVGSQALDQLSTKIRPKKKYKTNRKNLDGGALDIQKHLSKLGEIHMRTPTMKKYNYCGPGTKLEERLTSNDPKIRDPINNLDSICKRHDIAYSKAKNLKDKHKADDVMLDEISKIPYMKRPWGTTAVQAMITGKRKLGLGLNDNNKKIYCGTKNVPKNKKRGTIADCVKANQIRYYGLNSINEKVFNDMKKNNKLKKEQEKLNKLPLLKNFDKNKKYTIKKLEAMLKENKKFKNLNKKNIQLY